MSEELADYRQALLQNDALAKENARLHEYNNELRELIVVPEGMVMVPVEPTEKMLIAAVMSMSAHHPKHIKPMNAILTAQPKDIYKAMIQASKGEA